MPITETTGTDGNKVNYFPDLKFQDYLKNEVDDGDGFLSDDEIAAVTKIDLTGYAGIENVQGIEVFENLEYFICEDLKSQTGAVPLTLKFKDSAHNTDKYSGVNAKLKYVSCNHSDIAEIDLTGCPEVTYLNCSDNESLTSLDLQKNSKLEYLYCSNTGLSAPDLSKNTELRVLDCSYKRDDNITGTGVFNPTNGPALTKLNLAKNAKLEYLDCSCDPAVQGNLATLTLGEDSILRTLDCSNTKVKKLDLTKTITLETLNCAGTDLEELDLSKNTALESLLCEERTCTALATSSSPAQYTNGASSKIKNLIMNRLLYKKAALSFDRIFSNMVKISDITIDYNTEKDTNIDIYYTGNVLDTINVVADDITKPAKFKQGAAERTVTYTNSNGTAVDLTIPEKEGDYTLSKATRLFKDVNRTNVINGEPIIVYSNGASQRITAEDGTSTTKDTRKTIVYTDIAASYTVNENGKAGMGKVVVGITDTATIPTVANNKIDGASTAATAKIKNGQITITASNNATSGNVCYLWVIDTGINGTYECCPINILVAPRKIEVRNKEDKADDPQLKDATRMIGEKLEVCIAGYADTGKTIRTMDSTYTWTVPDAVKDCVEITPKGDDRFIIKAVKVNDSKDTKVPITFKCNQNKQKIKFTFKVSAVNTTP